MGIINCRSNNLLCSSKSSKHKRLLILGLDSAGKTSLLYRLKDNEFVSSIPTVGFNVEVIKLKNYIKFTVWDVGGQVKLRSMWEQHASHSDALIYVVDASDRDRFSEAKEELITILNLEEIKKIPILILANKQDQAGAMSAKYINDNLNLSQIIPKPFYHVHQCSALSGDGLFEALRLVYKMLSSTEKEFQKHYTIQD